MSTDAQLVGVTLDERYQITRLMGEGGMGQVYEGFHVSLERKVAVKVLHPRLAHDEKFRERFLREARAASKIRHPNVVQILDFGKTPQDSVYFVMEYLEGRDLRSLVKESGALPWSKARPLLLQAVGALKAAHARGIIHRDIKPANCFLYDFEGDGSLDALKVLDFGIAKTITNDEDDEGLTGTGEVFGTATYMAPEQAHGEELDARSDIYSFGIMAYEMVVGRVPFTGANPIHIITRHLSERPRPPRELVPSLPIEAEALILRAVAKTPTERFQSMAELETALRATPSEECAVAPVPHGAERQTTDVGAVVTDRSGPPDRTEVAQTPLAAQGTAYPHSSSGAPSAEIAPVPSAGLPTGDPYVSPEASRNSTRPPLDEPDVATTPHNHAPVANVGTSAPVGVPAHQVADTSRMLTGTGERKKPPLVLISVGILAVFGLSIGGGVLLFGSSADDEASTAAPAPGSMIVASEEVATPDERPVLDSAGGGSSGAPPPESASSSGDGDDVAVQSSGAEAPTPADEESSDVPAEQGEREPEPTPPPRSTPTKAARPRKAAPKPTDESVKKRLSKAIKRKCSAGRKGTRVSAELTVGSKGNILHKIVSASGELKSCVNGQLRGSPFPEGSARQVKLSIEL